MLEQTCHHKRLLSISKMLLLRRSKHFTKRKLLRDPMRYLMSTIDLLMLLIEVETLSKGKSR